MKNIGCLLKRCLNVNREGSGDIYNTNTWLIYKEKEKCIKFWVKNKSLKETDWDKRKNFNLIKEVRIKKKFGMTEIENLQR